MSSIFSELPNNLIIEIIRIENDRKKYEQLNMVNDRKKYEKVVEQLNMVTTFDEFCPSIRETMNGADDDDHEGLSVSEIWGWDEMRVMDDISWLNELWWNGE